MPPPAAAIRSLSATGWAITRVDVPSFAVPGVRAGALGVAGVAEEFVHEELSKGRLRKLATDFEIPPRSVDLCVLRDVPLTPAAQRFADFVKDSLSQRSGAPLNWEN